MVLLVTTSRILSAVDSIPSSEREQLDLPETLSVGGPISHDQLIRLARWFRHRREERHHHDDEKDAKEDQREDNTGNTSSSPTPSSFTLNDLLCGTTIYIPPPPNKPEPVSSSIANCQNDTNTGGNQKSPEYLAQKARIISALQTDAYNRLIHPNTTSGLASGIPLGPSPIFSSSSPITAALYNGSSSQKTEEEDTLTPSLVVNIFLSVLITGFSVYWALTSFQAPLLLLSRLSFFIFATYSRTFVLLLCSRSWSDRSISLCHLPSQGY